MKTTWKWLLVTGVMLAVWVQPAEAAQWKFHFRSNYIDSRVGTVCPGGDLAVYGTIDCVNVEPPLFQGYATRCQTYQGAIPGWANDIKFIFDWNYICANHDEAKWARTVYNGGTGQWENVEMNSWIDDNIDPDGEDMPGLGDPTGVQPNIYFIADPAEWLADPRPLQDWYTVVNGECEDLPGYLIGTTPIVFDPHAGPGGNPFSTTPFTGTLERDSTITFVPEPTVAIVLAAGAVAVIRRRRKTR